MLQNIDKAKKEIERLETEASEATSSDAPRGSRRREDRREDRGKKPQSAGANKSTPAEAEGDQERDALADVTNGMKNTSVENGEKDAAAA